MSWKQRTWEIVEVAEPGDRVSRYFDAAILTLILLNVLAVIIGSVAAVEERFGRILYAFEVVSVAVFTAEYAARLWACAARLRFALTPLALIDLLAILPFYLPFLGFDLRFVRALRLLRVLRVAKLGRYVHALSLFGRVLKARREELILTTALMLLPLTISSCLMYYAEHAAQPDRFSSIPAAMWWAVTTLTTVGYGDIHPIPTLGKLCGAVVAILGIGFFALPAAILGSGFVEEVHRQKKPETCPHCNKELPSTAR